MTEQLLQRLPARGPEGFDLVEDGAFGIDLVRPSGTPFNGITADQMQRHGFVAGWFRLWAGADRAGITYAFLLGSPEQAIACAADQIAEMLAAGEPFEVPASPLDSRFRVFARQTDSFAISWAVTTDGAVTLWLETQAPTAHEALALLGLLAAEATPTAG